MSDTTGASNMTLTLSGLGNATSGGSSTKSDDHEDGNVYEEADEFDAKLEKRRKHRADMKQNTLSNLDRLVDVAARLEHMEA